MKITPALWLIKRAALLLLLSALHPQLSTFAQGTAFTYQGRLTENGAAANGTNDFTFTLYDAATNGGMLELNLVNDLAVTNGLFTVPLNFTAVPFDGSDRWLQIAVRPGASTGAYTNLDPRQPITATPYAIRALNAGTAGSATTASSVAAGAVGTTAIADGSITSADLNASLLNTTFWKLTGNDFAPGQFLGSTNNQPLELKVGGQRALRLEPRGALLAPNVLGGYHENTAGAFRGAAIAGGGTSGAINQADGNYGFIGAGIGGRVADSAVVGAGAFNSALGNASIVGSGYANTNRGQFAAVVAGSNNVVALGAYSAFIGGGGGNQAIGAYSTVPGGRLNSAVGNSSFAAGNQAKANHTGAFVWADSTGADFASTGNDQFLIRAAGGVGIGTTTPATALDVNGTVTAAGLHWAASELTADQGGSIEIGLSAAFSQTPYIDFHYGVFGPQDFNVRLINDGDLRLSVLGDFRVTGTITASSFNGNAGMPFMLGTTDDQPLEFKVNNQRGLRLEYATNEFYYSVNVIGGSAHNSVGAGVIGATIGGGGSGYFPSAPHRPNRVDANYSTVSGGDFNTIQTNASSATIGGGYLNTIQTNASSATIGGGSENTIQPNAGFATIGGGDENTIRTNAASATIGGGQQNTIQTSASAATIGGGDHNTIQPNAFYATIPGGHGNSATNRAFAAGSGAKANHTGAFVWADSTGPEFASTAANQFAVRANGGVRFATEGTANQLAALNQVVIGPNGTTNAALRLGFHGYNGISSGGVIQATDGGPVPLELNPFGGGVSVGGTLAVNGAVTASSAATEPFEARGTVAGYSLDDRVSGSVKRWVMYAANGTLAFYSAEMGSERMFLDSGGNLFTAGAVNPPSDRNAKENFAPVDARAVLDKVAALPLSEWNYKTDTATRHVGPMAQDFHAAFAIGTDDKHIATVDADGVALAAIQGLNQKVEEQGNELKQKQTEITELKRRLEKLEQLMNRENGGAR